MQALSSKGTSKKHKRNWKFRFVLIALGISAVLLLWSGITRIHPEVPSPSKTFSNALHWMKEGIDTIYLMTYEDELDASAERVRALAVDQDAMPEDDEYSDIDADISHLYDSASVIDSNVSPGRVPGSTAPPQISQEAQNQPAQVEGPLAGPSPLPAASPQTQRPSPAQSPAPVASPMPVPQPVAVTNPVNDFGVFKSTAQARTRMVRMGRAGKIRVDAVADSIMQRELKGLSLKPAVGGKVINIVVIGIDSRLGARGARADAIHLFTINPDSAIIDITSIPRGAYLNLGYPDTSRLNKITYARMRGIKRFMRAVEKVTKKSPVKYYVEAGFSQVMGILELLRYKDPVGTLQFLRARKAFYTGDVQRSHNQGVFLRKSLVDRFGMLKGASGEVIIRTGLQFVKTNLTADICKGLVHALSQKGFPKHRSDAVRVKLPKRYKYKLKTILPETETIASIKNWAKRRGAKNRDHDNYMMKRLRKMTRLASRDSNRAGRIIYRLERVAEQHAWFQIQNKRARYGIRDTIIGLLEYAYTKVGKLEKAKNIRESQRAEDLLWKAHGLHETQPASQRLQTNTTHQ
jgi:hypothetical protein